MALSPEEILAEVNPGAVPLDQPDPISNYREADMQGISCAFCAKFAFTGLRQEAVQVADAAALPNAPFEIPVGVCEQWEARVDGVHVCDRFASGAPAFDENGLEVWDFADSERSFAEVHLANDDQVEKDGKVIKEILRTGEWPFIPTKNGLVKKQLRIVRDGKSNKSEGIISLSELVENFEAGAIPRVQIPLSDNSDDHQNTTKVNTGFVDRIWIVDKGESGAALAAEMNFTEPDVKERTLRGTYADVSCGIPWEVRSRGKEYGASLEHVCITNRPFISDLGPFLAASDGQKDVEVVHFGEPETADKIDDAVQPTHALSYEEQKNQISNSLLRFGNAYKIKDINRSSAQIYNEMAEISWEVPFSVQDEKILLSDVADWVLVEEEKEEDSKSKSINSNSRKPNEIEKSQFFREIRLSNSNGNKGGSNMPVDLDQIELSDEARAEVRRVLDENAQLRSRTQEAEADRRIDSLKEMGFSERPGALKFYREVYLADDGGPSVVLLSDDNQQKKLKAIEILDQFIDGIKAADEKVHLSDQALVSGNDKKPPLDAADENKSVEERTSEAREALGIKEKKTPSN